jgi:hypothetical protein
MTSVIFWRAIIQGDGVGQTEAAFAGMDGVL